MCNQCTVYLKVMIELKKKKKKKLAVYTPFTTMFLPFTPNRIKLFFSCQLSAGILSFLTYKDYKLCYK